MKTGGRKLRLIREELGLTMRDVEHSTVQIAERRGNTEFLIPPSRLSDIETKEIVPSIFRFYSLAVVYRRDIRDLLALFDVDLNQITSDMDVTQPAKTHFSRSLAPVSSVNIPIRLHPGFDPRRTSNFSRMVERWGAVPFSYLEQLLNRPYAYGYIGGEDFTMYPILLPGSFVQIDESRNKVARGRWKSEYERPIYFVETREGYTCCWCTLSREDVILQPHPLSPVAARVLRYPQDAEILGQVVGCAMTLGEWRMTGEVVDDAFSDFAPNPINFRTTQAS
jgi:transcriptional regulator with XRE-family HTH domain